MKSDRRRFGWQALDDIVILKKPKGQKQALQPTGRPLPRFTAKRERVTEAEVDAAVEVWDENDDLPSGLLEARTASVEELEEAE